ncbi:hypothetical protein KI387_022901, partial [Taxus chinensis]
MYGYAGGLSTIISVVSILGRNNLVSPSEFAIVRITETLVGISCYIMVEMTLQSQRATTVSRKTTNTHTFLPPRIYLQDAMNASHMFTYTDSIKKLSDFSS